MCNLALNSIPGKGLPQDPGLLIPGLFELTIPNSVKAMENHL